MLEKFIILDCNFTTHIMENFLVNLRQFFTVNANEIVRNKLRRSRVRSQGLYVVPPLFLCRFDSAGGPSSDIRQAVFLSL